MDDRPIIRLDIRVIPNYGELFDMVNSDLKDTIVHIHILRPVITTMELLILTICMSRLERSGCRFRLFSNDDISESLNSMGHKALIENRRPDNVLIRSESAIIARISKETIQQYIIEVQMFVKAICPEKDLEILEHCLSELLNNVYDHSKTNEGAVLVCRHLHEHRIISVGVADFGIGIPSSVHEYFRSKSRQIATDIDCLKWAIKENNTTQSIPRNMGKGLDNVNSFVRSVGSKWNLLSGSAQLISVPSGNSYMVNPIRPFIGTAVSINNRIDNLNDAQSDYSEGW